MEKLFVDTSVLLKIIMENYTSPLEKFPRFIVFTSPNVIEETMFKIVTLIIAKEEKMEIPKIKIFRIKELFSQGKYAEIINTKLKVLREIRKNMVILTINEEIIGLLEEILERYRLLPNDALIAATCKYYGIRKIATFDEDFERVDFLEVVKL